MPEPLKSTGDIPTYDSYPAPSLDEPSLGSPRMAEPAARLGTRNNLNAAAERFGSTVGGAVGAVRRRLQVMPRRVDEAKERFTETGAEVRDDVRAAAVEWKESAQRRLYEARVKARRYVNEQPFQVLGAAVFAGFALGVGLRLWRWRHE